MTGEDEYWRNVRKRTQIKDNRLPLGPGKSKETNSPSGVLKREQSLKILNYCPVTLILDFLPPEL